MNNCQIPKYKTIFSLRIKQQLKELGIEPLFETDNTKKQGFKCWVYEESPAFLDAFAEAIGKKEGEI